MSAPTLGVIAASSPTQADAFQALIKRRKEHGLYAREVEDLIRAVSDVGVLGAALDTFVDATTKEELLAKLG